MIHWNSKLLIKTRRNGDTFSRHHYLKSTKRPFCHFNFTIALHFLKDLYMFINQCGKIIKRSRLYECLYVNERELIFWMYEYWTVKFEIIDSFVELLVYNCITYMGYFVNLYNLLPYDFVIRKMSQLIYLNKSKLTVNYNRRFVFEIW